MLEKISGLSQEEAKNYLLQNIESEVRHESAMKIKEIEAQLQRGCGQAGTRDHLHRHPALCGGSCRRGNGLCRAAAQ